MKNKRFIVHHLSKTLDSRPAPHRSGPGEERAGSYPGEAADGNGDYSRTHTWREQNCFVPHHVPQMQPTHLAGCFGLRSSRRSIASICFISSIPRTFRAVLKKITSKQKESHFCDSGYSAPSRLPFYTCTSNSSKSVQSGKNGPRMEKWEKWRKVCKVGNLARVQLADLWDA